MIGVSHPVPRFLLGTGCETAQDVLDIAQHWQWQIVQPEWLVIHTSLIKNVTIVIQSVSRLWQPGQRPLSLVRKLLCMHASADSDTGWLTSWQASRGIDLQDQCRKGDICSLDGSP